MHSCILAQLYVFDQDQNAIQRKSETQALLRPLTGLETGMWGGNMMGWGWNGGWGMFGLFHILWWVLIVLGIVVLLKWLSSMTAPRGRTEGDGALEILRERYAGGEIGKEDFDARKRDLGG